MQRLLPLAVLCVLFLGAPSLHAKGRKPPIVLAAEQGDIAAVKSLLDQGADKEAITVEGETPLMAAAARGHIQVISLLLDRGADINRQSGTAPYHTALFRAVLNQREDTVTFLLDHGADFSVQDSVGKTVLDRARETEAQRIVGLLGRGKEGASATAADWKAFEMQRAVLPGPNLRRVEDLLKGGFDPRRPVGCGTFDALDAAVQAANPGLAELLLRYGAKPKEATLVNAAFVASHDSALRISRAFLEAGCAVNSKDSTGATALHRAVWRRNVELVSLLLARKDVATNEIDTDGRTPLMIAVETGDKSLVEMLLKAGANPAVRNSKGLTATDFSREKVRQQQEIENLLHPR